MHGLDSEGTVLLVYIVIGCMAAIAVVGAVIALVYKGFYGKTDDSGTEEDSCE